MATVAFVDLAGFSAITDVYGDEEAIRIIELFEELVSEALSSHGAPLKWIGDEAMLAFSSPDLALEMLGRLLASCRSESRLPLTRCGVSHGRVIRRSNDVFGSTVNIASRVTALAGPGQLLATQSIADIARAKQIVTSEIGNIALRSVTSEIPIFSLELAPAPDPSWIDPVCKMHPPYRGFKLEPREEPWFCSASCAEAYSKSPKTYAMRSVLQMK
ncbi:adenylate/guanylate cyclase domain-containing protein [Pseudorhodoplanes sp.]|uniref:adenylate/guanylate cyclase domain-containing protein n=1 Tax=Pseudorhodoplanes sp. TaxID=1934341 RepID=UPI00391C9F23